MSKDEKTTLKLRLTFTEPLLGTLPGDKEIAKEFITSKHPEGSQEDEEVSLRDEVEKQSTFFSYNDKNEPILWDYQVKGFFKDACSMMLRVVKVPELRAHKKIIDGLIFVYPRQIPLVLSGDTFFKERPARASTPKGERTFLIRSQAAPKDSYIEIEIVTLKPSLMTHIKKWLDYGALRGLGQWRNASYGRFDWKELKSK